MQCEAYAEQYLELLFNSRKQVAESLLQKPISGEEFIIEYLSEQDEPVYPTELSEKMQVSSARIAAALRHLETVSLILRNADGSDARKHSIILSEEGRKRAAEAHLRRLNTVAGIFRAIGEEETKAFIRISEHIIRVCKEQEGNVEKSHHTEEGPAQICEDTENAGPA